ncbi:MAG: hypothetical protein DRO11_02530 [Methanobacteriota archaeon]|nr:MAG: hypothetical protein DRO11_02530 [Euryarchaeota archaeon]
MPGSPSKIKEEPKSFSIGAARIPVYLNSFATKLGIQSFPVKIDSSKNLSNSTFLGGKDVFKLRFVWMWGGFGASITTKVGVALG